MADNHIQFKIGSTFSGEGFKNAQQAVNGMKGAVAQSTGAITQISTALGTMDGKAAQMARSVTGLLGVFTALNPVTIALGVGMLAYNEAMKRAKEYCDELLERVNAIHAKVQGQLLTTLASNVGSIADEIKRVNSEMTAVATQAKAFTDALNGLRASDAAGEIINLQVEKFNAGLNAAGEKACELSDAEYDLKIAVKTQETKIAAATNSVEAAQTAYDNNEKALTAATEAREKAETELARCEENFSIVAQNYDKGSTEYKTAEASLNQAKNLLTETIAAEDKARSDGTTLLLKLQTAEQNRENVINQSNLEVQKADVALGKVTNALEPMDDDVSEFIVGCNEAKEEMNKAAKSEAADALEELKKSTESAKTARDKLKQAEENYQIALDNYRAHLTDNLITQAVSEGTLGQSEASQARQAAAAAEAARAGIADGSIRNSVQQANAEKAAARAQRDAESSWEAKQEQRDQQRADRINKMGEKSRSKADQDFLNKFNARQKQKDADAQALKDAEMQKQIAAQEEHQARQNLQQIADKVKQLDIEALTDALSDEAKAMRDMCKLG